MTAEVSGTNSGSVTSVLPARQSSRPSAVISISWSTLAFAAGSIAIVSTSSLAIIATLNRADALSTIALALAILSFIIQIGLFIAQSWTSAQQVLHSEEVNADTRAILTEVRENARGTNRLISDQFDQVLGHLLDTTKRTVNESLKGQEAQVLNERLDRELRRTLRSDTERILSRPRADRRPLTQEEEKVIKELTTPISDAAERNRVDSEVKSLTPGAIADLNYFANDHLTALRKRDNPGLFRSLVRNVEELIAAGYVEKSDPPDEWSEIYRDQDYFILTPKGLNAARLFTTSNGNNRVG